MKTIANEYEKYITKQTKINDTSQTIYTFENDYQVSVLEVCNTSLFNLMITQHEIKDILLDLTHEQLIETLEEVKNYE
ncbi:TPA: hypothetical protein NR443_000341 [Listeria innocua]|nr:hypothetical protein [Listeria innocua]HCJ4344779.1 hypothetical protein [Listeria innocua]HCJ4473656.1 hypothetical protein [Listeria innocua]HCJ4505308.1 hypothetical protein [Listeria innocua]HCJ4510065.1 hypothetical protein [Listeria innocua]